MKIRSGSKVVFQNNYHNITLPSFENFVRAAATVLENVFIEPISHSLSQPKPLQNMWFEGIQRMQEVLEQYFKKKISSRFKQGVHESTMEMDFEQQDLESLRSDGEDEDGMMHEI